MDLDNFTLQVGYIDVKKPDIPFLMYMKGIVDKYGRNFLTASALENNVPLTNLLLKLGYDMNITSHLDENNMKLIHLACARVFVRIVDCLLAHGVNINECIVVDNDLCVYKQYTPVHVAVKHKHPAWWNF